MELSAKEKGLLDAREKYGEEAEAALREHLSMIGNELYLWMSDLYMPRECKCDNFDADGNRICLLPKDENGKCICRGGGYYYSNSARDNDGYEIDIESTVQAIHFLNSSGLLEKYNGNYMAALPSQMQKDVIAFAKSLQDPEDGYFYHPQWGKDIIPSRQGRDLGWATSILKELGDMPFYDTKNGHKGSLGAPLGVKAAETSENKNSTWIAHFQTLEAFKEYLNTLDLKNRSYPACNNINAQCGQLNARDKQAIADGEAHDNNGDGIPEDGFVAMLEQHFNERQNPEHGLWEDEVHYNSVNGLMKIVSSYNSMRLKFNYAEKAFDSAIKMALLPVGEPDCKGKTTTGSVDVYNPWVAMGHLLTNVKTFGTEEEYAALKQKLRDNVVPLIKATTGKAKKFKKEDGSFGYTWSTSPKCSQAAPVAVPDTVEGDINGGSIATRGIFGTMCSTLGLNIPLFSGEDFEVYIDRIKKRCNYN